MYLNVSDNSVRRAMFVSEKSENVLVIVIDTFCKTRKHKAMKTSHSYYKGKVENSCCYLIVTSRLLEKFKIVYLRKII